MLSSVLVWILEPGCVSYHRPLPPPGPLSPASGEGAPAAEPGTAL